MNLVTLVFLLGLASVVYLGWTFIPPWLDSLDVREATHAAFNRMATENDDSRIRTYLLSRANAIGTHWDTRGGTKVERPGLGLTERDITIERDSSSRRALIRVDYEREIRLKPTDQFHTLQFRAEKAGTLPQ